jgi:hypothetical protein
MGKVRGTLRMQNMQSHFFVLLPNTKFFAKPFIFKRMLQKKDFPNHNLVGLGAQQLDSNHSIRHF